MKLRAPLPPINDIQLLWHLLIDEIRFAHGSGRLLVIIIATVLICLVGKCIVILYGGLISFLRRSCFHF